MSGIRYLISGKVLEDGTFIPNKRSKAGRPAARQYGPDTCVLLPKDVNSYITDAQGVPYARGGLLPGGYYVEAVGQDQNVLRMSRFNPIDKTWSLIELGPFASYNHAIAAWKEEKRAGVEVLIGAFDLCDKAKQALRSRYL